MNLVSKANVDVQPYAFTTKSLYVGHFDYNYLRWQVIDTPGLLDHPLDQRNTIEMTAITALAHIYCTALFFIDVSESCGYSIADQISLFKSIKPLFQDRPILIVVNKIDLVPFNREALAELADYKWVCTSALTGEGVEEAKIEACKLLLQARLNTKIQNSSIEKLEKINYVTNVEPSVDRPPVEPTPKSSDEKVVTEKDLEEKFGGAGVYSVDLRSKLIKFKCF